MGEKYNVLVTGSTGGIGKWVCLELAARGHRVRGFDIRRSPDLDDQVVGSLAVPAELDAAMAGMDTVIHLAATPDEADFLTELLPNNVIGLYNTVEAARKAGIRRMILASSIEANYLHKGPWPATIEMPATPDNLYACTKVLAESVGYVYSEVHGMNIIVPRIGWCPRSAEAIEAIKASGRGTNFYLSPGDAGRFFACATEALDHVKYAVLFATSIPLEKAYCDTGPTNALIAYEPRDTWPEGTELVTPSHDA